MTEPAALLLCIAAGAGAGLLLGCLPGFHVYHLLLLLPLAFPAFDRAALPPEAFAALAAAAVAAWSVAGLLPALLLAVPDESTAFMLAPGPAAFLRGHALTAVLHAAAGALAGALFLLPALPLAARALPALLAVLRPHFHWIVWAVILFLILSEWPKGGNYGPAGWRRFADAAGSPLAGLATFLLAGLLGLLLFNRSPFPPQKAALALTPAFIGLFGLPPLLLSLLGGAAPVRQAAPPRGIALRAWLQGSAVGVAGGAFGAVLPAVSGGMGAWLAGQASAQSDDRAFLASQGAARMVYYAGALLLFAFPGGGLVRGGAAWQLQSICPHDEPGLLLLLAAAVAIGAAAAFLAVPALARLLLRLATPRRARRVALAALAALLALVHLSTGPAGLAVCAVATGIGAIPLLFHCRRVNALGIVLLPVALALSRVGPA